MLRCTFCNKVFQGTQFYATKHFTQQNYCKKVSDDALYQIAQKCTHRFEADQVERVRRFAHERGFDVPRSGAMGGEAERPAQGVGEGEDTEHYAEGGIARYGEGAGAAEEDEADVDLGVGVAEGERTPRGEGGWERKCGKKAVPPETTCTPSSSKNAVPDRASTPASSKRKEGGAQLSGTSAGKRLRQQKMTDTYGGEWIGEWRKAFFRWVYSSGIAFNAFRNTPYGDLQQVALRQPGGAPLPVLPSHNEIADMRTVEIHREQLAEELEEVRQPLWVSGATLLSDGRKSRDGRPIVNFLAAGSRGVVMYTTINREGEPDDAVHVLQRWVAIFHDFRFGGLQRVNAICTDSACAYVGAARALASPSMPPELRRITWLSCCVHVCYKLLSDIGTICTSFVDTITRARALVVFFKTHQAALSFFRKRSAALGLVLSCETRFASARIQHMMEPAHCAAFLLNPRRRNVQYFSAQLDRYHTWLVRQAKMYLLSQTRHDELGGRYLEVCRQFEDFHMQQGRYGFWGGAEGCAQPRSSIGDCETLECASWWSQYGGDAPDLQHCALRLMHMWSCASPAERNWAVHEGIHTKKRNQLAFEKVVHLVEITANVRLMEYRRAGCGYVLPWQRDEGMLDAQAGLDVEPVRSGTRSGMTEEEIEEQAALIARSHWVFCAAPSSAPPAPVRRDERSPAPVGREDLGSSLHIRGHGSLFSVARQLLLDPRASSDLGEMGVYSGAPPVEERERRAEEHGAAGAAGVEGIRGMEEEVAGVVGGVVAVDDGAHVEREEAMARVDDGDDEGEEAMARDDDGEEAVAGVEESVAGIDDGDAQVEMEEDVVRADAAALVGGEEGVVGGDVARGRGEGGGDLDPIIQRFVDDEMGPALAGLTPGTRRALGASPSGQRGASGLGMGDFMDMSLGDPPTPGYNSPPSRSRHSDSPSTPVGWAPRSPSTPTRPRVRDMTAVWSLPLDTSLFGRTDIDLDSIRRVTVHTARQQPGLGGADSGRGAPREVMAAVSQLRDVRGVGQAGCTLQAALAAAARGVREQTSRRSGVARTSSMPQMMPTTGDASLEESSGAEGLEMPRGSRREKTVAEVTHVSARLVRVRTGAAHVTVVEDDPETEPACEEAPQEGDEYRDDEERAEEESDNGDDDSYHDDDDEPSPSPHSRRRRGSRRGHDDVDDPSPPGRRETRSRRRRGSSVATAPGRGSVSSTRNTSGARQRGSGKGKGSRRY
ncbi:hypothetical protein CBR_g30484 [Chara braunii]|uniref:DUF659 domain-containing protein n=1 Tax=Chara braunii TaxID=69332 RepID=A0A388LCS3_CHABU|nr:hypothetical protein CBR_g30484 [Chara braunii]|eukprot:GBG80117.1 hypothetical protein CBR_g30484 [Chara braunii]